MTILRFACLALGPAAVGAAPADSGAVDPPDPFEQVTAALPGRPEPAAEAYRV